MWMFGYWLVKCFQGDVVIEVGFGMVDVYRIWLDLDRLCLIILKG